MNHSKIIVASIVSLCTMSQTTFAQAPARLLNEGSSFLPWAISGGLILLVGIIAFINPKRSHLN